MLSRVLGLVRDQVVMGLFGASIFLDAFFIAFRIPNLFREMLAEGALGSAFTKVYSEVRSEDRQKANQLLGQALYLAMLFAMLLSCLGFLLAPYLVALMTTMAADGHQKVQLVHQSVGLTRILFPFLGIAIVGAIVSGALYERGRFFLSAVAPMSFNICYILGAVLFSRWMEILAPQWWDDLVADPSLSGLAFGVLLGGLCQVGFQWRVVWQEWRDYQHSWRFPWSPDLKKVLVLMGPAALAASTGPINLVVNTNFAAGVGEGAISWLVAAFRIVQLPVGVFGVAVGVAVLPDLTRAIRKGGGVESSTKKLLGDGVEFVFWLMAACTAFLIGAHQDVISLLFEHGKFEHEDSRQTALALQAYAGALVGYGLLKVLNSFYYAVSRTKFAMYVAGACVLVNFTGNFFLVDEFGHVGLALTTTATLTVNCCILLAGLRRYGMKDLYLKILKLLIILGITCLSAYLAQKFCLMLWNSLNYGEFLGLKAKAAVGVMLGGSSTLVVFGVAVCLYFRQWPLDAIKRLVGRS